MIADLNRFSIPETLLKSKKLSNLLGCYDYDLLQDSMLLKSLIIYSPEKLCPDCQTKADFRLEEKEREIYELKQ